MYVLYFKLTEIKALSLLRLGRPLIKHYEIFLIKQTPPLKEKC